VVALPATRRRVGSETPRIFTPPLRKLTPKTTLGFEVIEFAEEVLGIMLLPWQKWLLVHALELLPDATFRFRTVVVLVARQNGKSTLAQVLALWKLYVDGARLVIGTAQNLDIAEDVWKGAVEIAQEVPELAEEIERVVQVNGKKALELTSGARYKVQTANRRGGRGLSGDLVILDELREHQTWDAWAAVTKTTLARAEAQVWALSNAGDSSSVVLRFLRRAAHKAVGDPDGLWEKDDLLVADEVTDDIGDSLADLEDDDSLGLFEWSAHPDRSVHDRDGWDEANPSLGHTITERAISSAIRTDPEPVARTEVLCQWVDGSMETVIPDERWRDGAPKQDEPVAELVSAIIPSVDVAPGQSSGAIAVAGLRADGFEQVEIIAHEPGMSWIIPRLLDVVAKHHLPMRVAMMRGPGGALVPDLVKAGFEVEYLGGDKASSACGGFFSAVMEGRLKHLDDASLNAAVGGAARRMSGDAWTWTRKDSTSDISPLVAATAARHVMAGLVDEPQSIQVY
jgi:hypothetical protein